MSVFHFPRWLAGDREAVALLEFALIMPITLFMILGGLEIAHFARAQLKVSQIAMTVADNAGRVTTGIDEANIYEVFAGADAIGSSVDFENNGRVILSSLEDNGQNGNAKGQMIRWQRCWGNLTVDPAYGREGIGTENDDLEDCMGSEGRRILAAPGTAVMFVEAVLEYEPLFAGTIYEFGQIRYESAFNVRGRENQEISNTQDLAVNDCN